MNYKLVVYIPELSLTNTKNAILAAGAGRLGNYDSCAWQVLGEGQFRPLTGSSPSIGKEDELEIVAEWRLEVLVKEEVLQPVVQALRDAHPYEEPAYEVFACVDI